MGKRKKVCREREAIEQRCTGDELSVKAAAKANIKCPECNHVQKIEIPKNSCLPFYKCDKCQKVISALKEICCVICAYSDKKCPVAK